MRIGVVFLLTTLFATLAAANPALHFEITDARGKKASGVTIEAGAPDAHGWFPIELAKSKGDAVLVCPSTVWQKLLMAWGRSRQS